LGWGCDVGTPSAYAGLFGRDPAGRVTFHPPPRLTTPDVAEALTVASERLALTDDGQVRVALRQPWADGTTHVVFDPAEFLEAYDTSMATAARACRQAWGCLVQVRPGPLVTGGQCWGIFREVLNSSQSPIAIAWHLLLTHS
jgi:hypothetical protein